MAKAYFYIKNHVQEVGYRVFVMSRILESSLKGGAINTPDGRVKVLLEGKKKDILSFIEELKKEKPELAKNPVMTQPVFNEEMHVPDELRFSQSLQLEQFGKAVKYLAVMNKKIDKLPTAKENAKETAKELEKGKLAEKISRSIEKGSLAGNIAQKIEEGKLATNIAKEIEQGNLPKRIAEEINKGDLPKRMAAELSKVINK